MAEHIELSDLDARNPYEEVVDINDLKEFYNPELHGSIDYTENLAQLKAKMAQMNIDALKPQIEAKFPNINEVSLKITLLDLKDKIVMDKSGELYLRDPNNAKAVSKTFGKHKLKVIPLTYGNGKLFALSTLKQKGLKSDNPLIKLLSEQDETEIKQLEPFTDSSYEDVERVRVAVTTEPIIEEGIRPLLQAEELKRILTGDDYQSINKYLDFLDKNKEKEIQLKSEIEFNKKELNKAKKQLVTETDENQKAILNKLISDSEARIITVQKLLDQLKTYKLNMAEDINTRLKSKFSVREKLGYIFRKYGLTITAITLALGLVIDTIVGSVRGTPSINPTGNNITDKIKQSLKNFSNWLLEMAKKALDNLPAIIGSIVSFLLKTTASVFGFLAEHVILFAIALAFALYEALQIGYSDIKKRKK